jgi:hypothetical protein
MCSIHKGVANTQHFAICGVVSVFCFAALLSPNSRLPLLALLRPIPVQCYN